MPRPFPTRALCLIAFAVLLCGTIAWGLRRAVRPTTPAPQDSDASASQNAVRDDKLLSLEQRQRLWDIEHIAFLVEQKGFPAIKRAFAKGDWQAFSEYLGDQFAATVSQEVWTTPFQDSVVTFRRLIVSEETRLQVGPDEFLKTLEGYRRWFDADDKSCNVSIGLVRHSPIDEANTPHKHNVKTSTAASGKQNGELSDANQFDMACRWKGVWRITLTGTRGEHRVEAVIRLSVELGPLGEKIEQQRHWIHSASIDKVEVAESTSSLMRDVTANSGLNVSRLHDNWKPENHEKFITKTGGVYLCDYNQDGKLDTLVEDINTGPLLYRGLGNGTFVDATDEAKLPRLKPGEVPLWTVSCWADFDGDGDEDLISQDRLYENAGDGTFRDVTEKTNLLLTPCAGYAVADYDLDGDVDLYVCHSDKYLVGQKTRDRVPWIDGGLGIDNVLWRNNGNWQFENVTRETNTGGGGMSCFAAVWFDANDDRRPDLLAINEFGRNALFISHPDGTFQTAASIDPVFCGLSMGVTAGDFDNDGHTDVYVANMYSKAGNRVLSNVDQSTYPRDLYEKVREATVGSKLYRSLGGVRFEVIAADPAIAEAGWAYGPNFVDLNGDGLLDLYATAGFKSVERGKPDG